MLKNIFKGMLIGIANIIPGVSGGTMAVSMGIYDRLIHCISHPFKDLKHNILFLLPIALGILPAHLGLPIFLRHSRYKQIYCLAD